MKKEIREHLQEAGVIPPTPASTASLSQASADPEPLNIPKTVPETEAEYIERRLREENTERFRNEFAQHEILRKRREEQEAEEAREQLVRNQRERYEHESFVLSETMSETETCPVCGTQRVPKVLVTHNVYGTEDKCIRKPREAKACGIITADAWEMLTDQEKCKGYILRNGASLFNAKVLKEVTPVLYPETINPLLR